MVLGPDPSIVKDGHARSVFGLSKLSKLYWDSGIALIATAAFLFSCTGLSVKLLGDEVPTFQVVLVPGIICFMATSVVVKISGLGVRNKSWRISGLTLLRGLLGATSITCFYLAIELLPLQDAVTLFFCSPVVAILLELLVTGESPGWAAAAATACTVAGVVLVAQPPCVFSHHSSHHSIHSLHSGAGAFAAAGAGAGHGGGGFRGAAPLGSGAGSSAGGVALATAAAIANAAAFVVVRLIRQSQSTVVLTFWYHGVVVAVSAIPLALGYPAPPVLPTRRGCLLLGVVGVTQLVGQLLLNRGFQLESATRGSAINVLQVLFSFVWDVAVLGDKPGVVSVAGSSLVAAGVLCVTLTGEWPGGLGREPWAVIACWAHHQPPHQHHQHQHQHRGEVIIRMKGDLPALRGPCVA
ncbi:hypothetical protein PLESTM_000695700 [Pleodorina starrii]|nr:hypothetical protein PLESTM_000695700 [Pleodorina starrii]